MTAQRCRAVQARVVLDVNSGRAIGLHYAGTALETNYAVPASDLAQIISKRPWTGEAVSPRSPVLGDNINVSTNTGADMGQPPGTTLQLTGGGEVGAVTFVVPLEISVKLAGRASSAAVRPRQGTTTTPRTDREAADASMEKVRQHLLANKSVLSVKADYLFRDGVITDDYGVIVGVAPGASVDARSRAGSAIGSTAWRSAVRRRIRQPSRNRCWPTRPRRSAAGWRKYQRQLTGDFKLDPVTERYVASCFTLVRKRVGRCSRSSSPTPVTRA